MDPEERDKTLKQLNVIAIVAVLDALLLAPLIWASLTEREGLVSILGPVHGFGFLALLGLVYYGVRMKRWGWWFPALVVVTLGPLGSLIGDAIVRRRLRPS